MRRKKTVIRSKGMRIKMLHSIFHQLKETDPRPELFSLIMERIDEEREREARRWLLVAYVSLSASLCSFLAGVILYGRAFLQSDFWSLVTLAFSDMAAVADHGADFLLSLLETFPVGESVMLLIPIFAVLFSVKIFTQAKEFQQQRYYYVS